MFLFFIHLAFTIPFGLIWLFFWVSVTWRDAMVAVFNYFKVLTGDTEVQESDHLKVLFWLSIIPVLNWLVFIAIIKRIW